MDKKIRHIGTKNGKLLFFGGIYSNLQALEKLILIAKTESIPPENCICTGDITGYCAQPEETVNTFREWGALSIAGNVELQLANDSKDCGCDFKAGSRCDSFSKRWFPYTKEQLSTDSIQWISKIPKNISFSYKNKKVTVVHGSYNNVSEFIFASTPEKTKRQCLEQTQSHIIVAGHCGLPFSQTIKKKLWLNPGVIGMPANDGTQRVWYMLMEIKNGELKYAHKSFEYDFKSAKKLMYKNHLPKEYADTLSSGIWDNMEILPQVEKMGQGIPLNLDIAVTKIIETKKL